MQIHLSFIPGKVQHFAANFANIGEKIKTALQSNTAIEIDALIDEFIPATAALRPELIALTIAAVNTCTKIATEDWSGVTARLQRLTADASNVWTGNKHNISTLIQWVEVVIRDILDGGTGTNKPADDESTD